MLDNTRENGRVMSDKAKGSNAIQTATLTMVISRWARLMVKVFTVGPMVRFMMVSGTKDSNTVTEYGEDYITILILGSGVIPRQKDMEFIPGRMETGMKVSGSNA